MNANRWIQLCCVLFTAACIFGASLLVPGIQEERKELQVSFRIKDGGEMPWQIALANTTLASFRGLILDIMWYRAESLKNDGQYQEADTLARWITQLQPRFGQVWAFQAWNMAYNISVGTQTPEERWEWVSKGINLLRDEGIPYNESNVQLYKELSWIFFHKVGQYTDDMHWYYKSRMAREWTIILGSETEGGTTEEIVEAFRKVADAPLKVGDLVNQDPEVAALVAKLEEMGIAVDSALARQLGTIKMYNRNGQLDMLTPERVDWFLAAESLDKRLLELTRDEAMKPAIATLLHTLRKRIITFEKNMDPQYMLKCMTGEVWHGSDDPDLAGLLDENKKLQLPLDWRHPAAHSLYWSILGTEKAIYKLSKKNVDQLNTYRNNIHSLQLLMYSGRIHYDPFQPPQQDIRPFIEPRYIPAYDLAFSTGVEYIRNQTFVNAPTEDSFDMGHMNFLEKAVAYSYLYGQREQAEFYWAKLKRLYSDRPDNVGPSGTAADGRYSVTLEQFVDAELPSMMGEFVNRVQLIESLIIRSIIDGLAMGDFSQYQRMRDFAAKTFKKEMLEEGFVGGLERGRLTTKVKGQTNYQAFADFEAAVFVTWMRRANVFILNRSMVWRNAPPELRQRTYDELRSTLKAQSEKSDVDFDKAFPEPPGMEAWRKANPQVQTGDPTRGDEPQIERK